MKIVLDARAIRPAMTGVGHYTRCLAEALPRAGPEDSFVFLALRGSDPALRPSFANRPNAQWREVDVDHESHPRGDWWEHRALPRLLDELDADVFHGPAFLIPFGRRKPRAARVVTVHDLSVYSCPRAYPLGFRLYLRWVIARSLRAADAAIFLSDSVRREALALAPELSPDKCRVVAPAPAGPYSPMPPDEIAAWRKKLDLPAEFLLTVGTLEERKNPLFLIELHRALARRGDAEVPAMVWLGLMGFGGKRILGRFDRMRRAGKFRYEGDFSPDLLRAYYNCASALVYPSLNEGFGLPAAEAMACGLPVIASNRTALPEAVGEGGRCLALEDVESWADAVREILHDPEARARARRRALDRATAFSWERAAKETLSVYGAARERRP